MNIITTTSTREIKEMNSVDAIMYLRDQSFQYGTYDKKTLTLFCKNYDLLTRRKFTIQNISRQNATSLMVDIGGYLVAKSVYFLKN